MRNGREYDRLGHSDIWENGKILDVNDKVILDFSDHNLNKAGTAENDRPVVMP